MARSYGQFCGLARAADVLGERWALLIVRDLLVSSKRFGELHDGLPGIPSNVLTARLRQLEQAGVVERVLGPRPARSVLYALTPYGRDLEPVVVALGLWGARRMLRPEPDEIVTGDSLAMALRSAFQPSSSSFVATFELSLGPATAHARVDGRAISVGAGALAEADLKIRASPALRAVLAGKLGARAAVRSGEIVLVGPVRLFDEFARLFRVPLDESLSA